MINHPTRRRSVKQAAAASPAKIHDHDHDYTALLSGVRMSFEAAVQAAPGKSRPVFRTDVEDSLLYNLYLEWLPAAERQIHNCHACRRFIDAFGGLVAINDDGHLRPLMWDPDLVPEFYRPAFTALATTVTMAHVTTVFLSSKECWGTPITGEWSHISVAPPAKMIYRGKALSDTQAMAAAKENYYTVANALLEFTAPMLDEALRLLNADALARSEKFIGPVQWLRKLHDLPKGRFGENLLRRAIALAPEGYCHPKASVVAPLLADIVAGLPFEEIKRRFNAKLHPLAYQRPQAAPSAGNIKAAEAMVEKLGIAPSLERRFARLDELQTMWKPTSPPAPSGEGVFGHLTPKEAKRARKAAAGVPKGQLPRQTMTWAKFSSAVLSGAEQMEIWIPPSGRFVALTTAVDADAPSILKWDHEEERNPVAWYVYTGLSPASQWGLSHGVFVKVTAVAPFPNLWGLAPKPHLFNGAILVIEGCVDTRDAGNALFPEILKEELHGVRSTIEAYAARAKLSGRETASACGWDLRKDGASCRLRVLANGAWSEYQIDRWD